MKKKISRVNLSEDQTRVTVQFEDIDTTPHTLEAQHRQVRFLQELIDTPTLLLCDTEPFQNLRMFHDGTRWIVELMATVTK